MNNKTSNVIFVEEGEDKEEEELTPTQSGTSGSSTSDELSGGDLCTDIDNDNDRDEKLTRPETADATKNEKTKDRSNNGVLVAVTSDAQQPQLSDEVVDDEEKQLPCWLGWWQLLALLQKNLLLKYRTPWATLMELLSPALVMLIVVGAYQLSEITYKDAELYSQLDVQIPGPWLKLAESAADFIPPIASPAEGGNGGPFDFTNDISNNTSSRRSRRRLLLDDYEDEPAAGRGGAESNMIWDHWPDSIEDVLLLVDESSPLHQPLKRRLEQEEEEETGGGQAFGVDEDEDFEGEEIYDLLNEARRQLNRLLADPIPCPSFAQYVALSEILSRLIDAESLPRLFSESEYGRKWGNLLTLGTLHLAPANVHSWDFWSYLNVTYPLTMGQSRLKVRLHETESDAIEFINGNLNERTWALLNFGSWLDDDDDDELSLLNNTSSTAYRYKIRMNYTTLPSTSEITNFVSIGLNKDYQQYYLSGYLSLQRTLNEFAMSLHGNNCTDMVSNVTSRMWSMPFPTAAYSQNSFYLVVGYLLGLTIVMAFLYPTSRLIKGIVEEKETRMRETMFILGVRPWANWWAWLVSSLVVFFIVSLLVTQLLSANVLIHSSTVYLFMLIWLFSTATIGFCFFIAAFFNRAKLASIVGPISLFVTLLPRYIFFGYNRYEATTAKMWASLLPATAFAFGADIIADYEYAEQGKYFKSPNLIVSSKTSHSPVRHFAEPAQESMSGMRRKVTSKSVILTLIRMNIEIIQRTHPCVIFHILLRAALSTLRWVSFSLIHFSTLYWAGISTRFCHGSLGGHYHGISLFHLATGSTVRLIAHRPDQNTMMRHQLVRNSHRREKP